jgi:hypothetical protein
LPLKQYIGRECALDNGDTLECLMDSASPEWLTLVAFPGTRSPAIRGIEAQVQLRESTATFRYLLRGDISRVRIPPLETAERADGLWRHTCFEAFVRTKDGAGYHELNVAPSRQWSVYRFDSYRQGMSSPGLAPPEISVRRFDDRLEVDAVLALQDLIARRETPRLQIALSAVIEEENGTLSYWALKHAPGKPDFHFPGGFLFELAT